MELHLGKMTGTELAKWFNISAGGYRNNKQKRLEILKDYCRFHEEGPASKKTVIIDEIYVAVYEGDKPKARRRIAPLTKENWEDNGYDTVSNLQQKNKKALKEEGYNNTESTIVRYTYLALNELVGYSKARSGEGEWGRYEKVWGVSCDEGSLEKYRPLTEAECAIKAAVSEKFFANKQEDEELAIASILEWSLQEKCSQKETNEMIGAYKRQRHEEWINKVSEAIGRPMIVLIKVEWSAFKNEGAL